jgi:hypothetical protein
MGGRDSRPRRLADRVRPGTLEGRPQRTGTHSGDIPEHRPRRTGYERCSISARPPSACLIVRFERGHLSADLTVRALADTPGAVLFDCVGGKDRAGGAAALLLRRVGVSMDDVETDYVRTAVRARSEAEAPHIDRSAPGEVITEVLTALETHKWSCQVAIGGPCSRRR